MSPTSQPDPAANLFQRRLFLGIGTVVLLWGLFLAIGAIFNSEDRSLLPTLKGIIIFAFFAAFLGFWGLLVWLRKPRRQPWEDDEES